MGRSTKKKFPFQLTITLTTEDYIKVISMAYLLGRRGRYLRLARQWIDEAIQRHLDELSPEGRREFDEIVENVRIAKLQLYPDLNKK